MIEHKIIKSPLVSEKTNNQKDILNKFVFKVDLRANRIEIRKAVEKIFNVKVISVNTVNIKGKVKRKGQILGVRSNWKKAIITLVPGQKIKGFDGI